MSGSEEELARLRGALPLDEARDAVVAAWSFDQANYPLLQDYGLHSTTKHVILHCVKDAGRMAAAIEPYDHGREVHTAALRRSARNMLVNTLRLCGLMKLSPAELIADYLAESSAAALAASPTPPDAQAILPP